MSILLVGSHSWRHSDFVFILVGSCNINTSWRTRSVTLRDRISLKVQVELQCLSSQVGTHVLPLGFHATFGENSLFHKVALVNMTWFFMDQKGKLFFLCNQKPPFFGMPNVLYPPSWKVLHLSPLVVDLVEVLFCISSGISFGSVKRDICALPEPHHLPLVLRVCLVLDVLSF